jgi:hypothetical protein
MDVANPPDHTGRDELLDAARLGMKPIHEAFHEADAMLCAGLDLLSDAIRGRRQWLLAEHGFACSSRANGPFSMQGVRKGDVHGVYVVVFEQRFVAANDPSNSERLRDAPRLLDITARKNFDRP